MGMPPTFNFWAEIFIVIGAVSHLPLLVVPLRACLFLAVVFRIILFLRTYTQKPSFHVSHPSTMPAQPLLVFSAHFLMLVYAPGLFVILFK
jgi:NADH:ubiquinone oxidoreductase subunit 4 (subunit M)